MVGGSGATGLLLHDTVGKIKEKTDLPVILPEQPGGALRERRRRLLHELPQFQVQLSIENQALGAPRFAL
jgi:hypothetical protein